MDSINQEEPQKHGPPNVTWPPPGHHGSPVPSDSSSGPTSMMCPPHQGPEGAGSLITPTMHPPPIPVSVPIPIPFHMSPQSDLQKLQNSISQMEEHGMTKDPRYNQVRQLHQHMLRNVFMKQDPQGPYPSPGQQQPPLGQPQEPTSPIGTAQTQSNACQKQMIEVKVSRINTSFMYYKKTQNIKANC